MTTTALSDPSAPCGLRVFTCGHSFHAWTGEMLAEMAQAAGIRDHRQVGVSAIGRSLAIQHWDVPIEQNEARKALRAGGVDVLTLSCMTRPDEGIRKFAELAAAHNPEARVTLQELWLPEDRFPFDPENRVRKSVDEFDAATMAGLKGPHDAYVTVMEDYVAALNAQLGRQVVFIVPDAQATLALRAKIIAGAAPGLQKQSDLFRDPWGHPTPPLKQLSACCHFAVIYRRSPVGLPLPSVFEGNAGWGPDLNRVLQELAWDAVTSHPMSGVGATPR
jgi:hypothetical protein